MLLEELVADMESRDISASTDTAGATVADSGEKRLKASGNLLRLMGGGFFKSLSGAATDAGSAAAASPAAADIRAAAKRELQRYFAAPRLDFTRDAEENGKTVTIVNDPLQHWAKNANLKEYPNIACLARKYLCIPATSAPSECVFSTAGLTTTKLRNYLTSENARALIFLHNTWPVLDAMAQSQQVEKNCKKAVEKVLSGAGKGKGKKRKM
jgi:hypothetical protein